MIKRNIKRIKSNLKKETAPLHNTCEHNLKVIIHKYIMHIYSNFIKILIAMMFNFTEC